MKECDNYIEQLKVLAEDGSLPECYYNCEECSFQDRAIWQMKNKTFSQVVSNETSLIFANDYEAFMFFHIQDCCESVTIEDIVGELSDLAGVPMVTAEEVCDSYGGPGEDDSYTWTYYKFATIKGYVDVRWYGTSNGYYSEAVNLYRFPIKDGKLIRKD